MELNKLNFTDLREEKQVQQNQHLDGYGSWTERSDDRIKITMNGGKAIKPFDWSKCTAFGKNG